MIRWKDFSSLAIFKTLRLEAKSEIHIVKQNNKSVSVVSTTELANALDAKTRVVTLTAASTMTPEANGNGKINLLSLLAGFDTTLPEATGTGNTYHFRVGIVNTSNDYGILADSTDTLTGNLTIVDTDSTDNVVGFSVSGTDDKVEINATTKGGLTIGDWLEFTDVADALWYVRGGLTGSGTIVTPAAAT